LDFRNRLKLCQRNTSAASSWKVVYTNFKSCLPWHWRCKRIFKRFGVETWDSSPAPKYNLHPQPPFLYTRGGRMFCL